MYIYNQTKEIFSDFLCFFTSIWWDYINRSNNYLLANSRMGSFEYHAYPPVSFLSFPYNQICIAHSVIMVANVASNAIISNQYVSPDFHVLVAEAMITGKRQAMTGTYIICHPAVKHQTNEHAAATFADIEWTLLSSGQDRNAGAAPTNTIAAAPKKAIGCRYCDQDVATSPTSNHPGISNIAIRNINPVNTYPKLFFNPLYR